MAYTQTDFINEDKFQRSTFIKNIMEIIMFYNQNVINNDSLVISLDSPWGTGKTFLIKMWKNMLDSEKLYSNYRTIYYNAWENDDWDNPFIPFISCIKNEYTDAKDEQQIEIFFDKADKIIKSCAISMLKEVITKLAGNKLSEIIEDTILSKSDQEPTEDIFSNYLTYLDEKNRFIAGLDTLIPNNGKLVIFIDELDRCRPDFAIQTLELIKHYFNNKNIVFIIAVDMLQLSHSISTIYGHGMDSVGYLRRFIDYSFSIPTPNINDYVRYRFEILKSCDIYNEIILQIIDKIIYMFRKLKLSLRDIDKISDVFITFLLYYKDNVLKHKESIEIYLYFIILKYKYPDKYDLIIHKKFSLTTTDSTNEKPFLDSFLVVNGQIMTLLKKINHIGAASYVHHSSNDFDLFEDNTSSENIGQHIENIIEML